MKITRFWHSCLLVEEKDTKLLVDPGRYSFLEDRAKPEDFAGLTAILLTHEHGDHADPNSLEKILKKNPVPVYGNAGTRAAMGKAGIDVRLFEDRIMHLGAMQVEALQAKHEELIKGTPQNTAYLIDNSLLISGDSYDSHLYTHKGIRALSLPVMSPWGSVTGAYEFLKKMSPKFAFPVHDGFALSQFMKGQYDMWEEVCRELGVDFRRMETPKEVLEV